MKRDPMPLEPPPAVDTAEWAAELVRLWAAEGRLHTAIRWDYFAEAGHWGVALVDFARHVARAYAEGAGRDPGVVMQEIRDAFDAEWERPTDLGTGGLR
ncbi:MAG: DUF5076 domain-containing protein [Myxococcota bacterium]|nr:DUF5076 domain-containing protein [Myxococcota bacterium]